MGEGLTQEGISRRLAEINPHDNPRARRFNLREIVVGRINGSVHMALADTGEEVDAHRLGREVLVRVPGRPSYVKHRLKIEAEKRATRDAVYFQASESDLERGRYMISYWTRTRKS